MRVPSARTSNVLRISGSDGCGADRHFGGVSTITMAELADPAERAGRQARLQQAESLFDPVDFDRDAARSYGQVVSAVASSARSHRGRVADLLIAAVAHAQGLDLYTRDPGNFAGPDGIVTVVPA